MVSHTAQRNHKEEQALRVGILGAGAISDIHAKILKSIPAVSLAAVCDRDVGRARRLRERYGIREVFGSLSEMLGASKPDVVQILLPPPFHCEAAIECMEAGCHVLIEKPMAVTVAECHDLQAVSARCGRAVGVNHNATYNPTLLRLIEEIESCRLGELEHVIICVNMPLRQLAAGQHDHWMFDSPWNVVLEQGPHPLSMLHRLIGKTIRASTAVSGKTVLASGHPFYDTWQISMLSERGSAQMFMALGREYADLWLAALGQDGAAFADLKHGTLRISEKTKFMGPVENMVDGATNGWRLARDGVKDFTNYALGALNLRPLADPYFSSMRASIAAFYEAVWQGKRVPIGLNEGTAAVEACEAITRSGNLFLESGMSQHEQVTIV